MIDDNKFFKLQDALKYLFSLKPIDSQGEIKPIYLHSIQVALRLMNNDCEILVCIAGLLHDTIEDFGVDPVEIENKFGRSVRLLVEANTKRSDLAEPEKGQELISRVISNGVNAINIKSADILENLIYFSHQRKPEAINKLVNYAQYLIKNNTETNIKLIKDLEAEITTRGV